MIMYVYGVGVASLETRKGSMGVGERRAEKGRKEKTVDGYTQHKSRRKGQ